MDAVVDRAHGPFEPQPPQQRRGRAQDRPRRAREHQEGEQERQEHERALDPEVRPDVVAADCQQEAHSAEEHRRRTAERPFEQHDRGDRAEPRGVATGGLEDPDGVAADRGGQDLTRRVGDEVSPGQPRQPLVHALRPEQPAPALGHRHDRERHDRDREQEPPRARVGEDLGGLADVDLPDEIGDREARQRERREDADPALHAPRSRIRPSASITSAMSSSEWAGDSGSERISSPARSATGSDGWSG